MVSLYRTACVMFLTRLQIFRMWRQCHTNVFLTLDCIVRCLLHSILLHRGLLRAQTDPDPLGAGLGVDRRVVSAGRLLQTGPEWTVAAT